MHVALVPFEGVAPEIVENLARDLSFLDEMIDIAPLKPVPDSSYNARRDQYRAEQFLDSVRNNRADKVLGITNDDLYVESLNFVFGLAERPGKAAVISIHRLREGADEQTFRDRVIKEAVHELGHTMGLGHCDNPRCVMHFSNSLQDTDHKGKSFCPRCQGTLSSSRVSLTS